jgi:hypothetical protein
VESCPVIAGHPETDSLAVWRYRRGARKDLGRFVERGTRPPQQPRLRLRVADAGLHSCER